MQGIGATHHSSPYRLLALRPTGRFKQAKPVVVGNGGLSHTGPDRRPLLFSFVRSFLTRDCVWAKYLRGAGLDPGLCRKIAWRARRHWAEWVSPGYVAASAAGPKRAEIGR